MAESYRGLTIRIGGDTTKLNKALHAANQAVAGTQSELRKLNQAIKLDPSSLNAANLQMGAMAEQASNTASRLVHLRETMQQIGSRPIVAEDGSVTTLEKMVEKSRDVQFQAALMRDGFNEANKSLAECYTQLSKLSGEIGSGKTFNVVNDDTDYEALIKEFELLRANLISLREEFGTGGLASLGFKTTEEDLENLWHMILRLKDESKDLGVKLDEAGERARFEDLTAETAKSEAAMKSYIETLAKANESIGLKEAMEDVADSLGDVDRIIDSTKSRLKQVDEALKLDPKNPQLVAERLKLVETGSAAAKAKAELLGQVIANFKAKGIQDTAQSTEELVNEALKAEQAYRKLATEQANLDGKMHAIQQRMQEINHILQNNPDAVNKQGEAYEDVFNELGEEYNRLEQESEELAVAVEQSVARQQRAFAQLSLHDVIEQFDQARSQSEHFGDKPIKPTVDDTAFLKSVEMVGQAARRMASDITQAANEIDTAYRDMRKTVNGTEEDFKNLHDAAIEYSQTHITSADTMLEMEALGGQLGILVEDLQEFGTITSNLDISTDMGAEDIALKLGQVANVLDLDIDGMQGFSDALVRLGNNMPAQESAIMNIAQRMAAVASTANFSGPEILAWAAAIASTGQRSEMAATAIGNTISGIEQAIAKGGSDIKAFATIANMSASEFTQAWKEDPTEALKAFISGLHELKESDESAVAALEGMGITGVRQQQTLLSLSNTVDNLGDALEMSSDAWYGISDRWGQAGDAAIEAQKKSEGFSGTLAIMQNNAQNLAASMGDGFIPLMQAASDIMKFFTDILNSVPAPVKSAVIAIGGISVVVPAVSKVIDVFGKGWQQAASAMTSSSGSIATMISKLLGIAAPAEEAAVAVEGTAVAAEGAGAAFSGPLVIGIGVALVAISAIIAVGMEWVEHTNNLRDANLGLVTSMDGVVEGYNSYVEGAANAGASMQELKERTDEVIANQAELANTMTSQWSEVGASEAMVDELANRIVELTSQAERSEEEQAELVAAVKSFNDETGSSIEVLDAVTGKLDTSNEAILDHAEAWKKAAESEAAYEMYKELVKQRIEDQLQLTQVTNAISDAQDKAGESLHHYQGRNREATGSIQSLKRQQGELEESIASTDEQMQVLFDTMDTGDSKMALISSYCEMAGRSIDEFGDLTDDQMDEVIAAFHRGEAEGIAALENIANAARGAYNAADVAGDLAKNTKEYAKSLAAQFKAVADAGYNARKAELNKAYKNMKATLDATYKEQKRAYDAEYNEAKRAYDNQYNEQKRAFDNQYNEQKRAYDHQYDALKRSLDKQLDALKKANDKKLKAAKKANDEEVAAFKRATDARLKEMEREYKAKLKLLEVEYGQSNDDIDERIKALEAETEAEKKAIEERERADKVAELKSAVDKAKSRRKRAEAEKALNDYLQEIESERNEDSRKSEIEQLKDRQADLKDELAARKAQLKEEYDAEVDAYKDKRAIELEALQDANQAEYDALKEKLDEQEAALKESNDIRLANLKEFQQVQLEAMKQSQSMQLEAMKQSQSEQLEAMKADHQEKLDELKAFNSKRLDAVKAANTEELQELKASNKKKYNEIKNGNIELFGEEMFARIKILQNAKALADGLYSNAGQTVTNVMSELFGGMEDATETGKKTGDGYKNGVTDGFDSTLTGADALRRDLGSKFSFIKDDAGESGKKTGADYKDGVKDGFDEALTGADALRRDLGTKFGIIEDDASKAGEGTGSGYTSGYERGSDGLDYAVSLNKDVINSLYAMSGDGYEAGYGMIDNIRRGMESAYSWLNITASNIAGGLASYFHHSTPDKGPLKDDDKWGGEFIQNLIDGMHDKERDLRRQVERMADVVEEGFNPSMSLDAAYEAIGAINKGHTSAASISTESKSEPSVSLTLNMNLSDVTVRDDTDIERLAELISQKMAAQTARQLAGRLG